MLREVEQVKSVRSKINTEWFLSCVDIKKFRQWTKSQQTENCSTKLSLSKERSKEAKGPWVIIGGKLARCGCGI